MRVNSPLLIPACLNLLFILTLFLLISLKDKPQEEIPSFSIALTPTIAIPTTPTTGETKEKPTPIPETKIKGLVMTSSRSKIEGATVTLFASEPDQANRQPLQTVVTDQGGSFSFVLYQPGRYRIQTSKNGFRSSLNDLIIQTGNYVTADIVLYHMEEKQGIVLDQDRSPLSGIPVHVVVKGGNNDTDVYVSSDVQGLFSFVMDESQHYILNATHENSVPAVAKGIFTDPNPELLLCLKGDVKGRVIDNQNQPVQFAKIHIKDYTKDPSGERRYGGTLIDILSDQNGLFNYSGLFPGMYQVQAEQVDFIDMGQGRKDMQLQTPSQEVQLILVKDVYTVSGRIEIFSSKRGVSNMRVGLYPWGGGATFQSVSRETVSNEDGNFTFSDIPVGYYLLYGMGAKDDSSFYVFPTNMSYATINVKNRNVEDVKLFVTRKSKIEGSVIDENGSKIPNSLVKVVAPSQSPEVRSDSDGNFSIQVTPSKLSETQEYFILASAVIENATLQGVSDGVLLTPDEDVSDVLITLHKEVRIEGHIANEQGIPLKNARVSIHQLINGKTLTTTSDESGYYKIDGLAYSEKRPDEAMPVYALGVKANNYADKSIWIYSVPEQKVIYRDVSMSPNGWIRGRVTDSENRPIEGVQVYAAKKGLSGVSAQTNGNGEYNFSSLERGYYDIRFEYTKHPTLSGTLQNVFSQSDYADIQLTFRTRTIEVEFVTEGDLQPEEVDERFSAILYKNQNGVLANKNTVILPLGLNKNFSIKALEPGDHILRINVPSFGCGDYDIHLDDRSDPVIYIKHQIKRSTSTTLLMGRVMPITGFHCTRVEVPWETYAPVLPDGSFQIKNLRPGKTHLVFWLVNDENGQITKQAFLQNLAIQNGGAQYIGDIYLQELLH